MIIYIVMTILSVFFAFLESKEKNKIKKIIYKICIVIPFFAVSAIRYDVGTDYMFRYVPNYLTILNGGDVDSLEILFKQIIRFSIWINSDYVTLFIITSAIILGLFFMSIFKNSKDIILSVLIFVFGSFFFESLNLVRQFIAISILFFSYKYLFDKKRILWGISVIIATLCHTVSVVFLISIFLYKKVINYKVFIAIVLIIVLFGNVFINLAANTLKNSSNVNIAKYARYIERSGDLPLSGIIVEVGVYCYIYLMYINAKKNKKDIDNETIFFVNMQTVAVIFTVMNIHLDLFFRFALLFSVFQIISIPHFYKLNKDTKFELISLKNKLLIKNWNLIMCIMVILLLGARMTFSNIIKGADEILPYKTIFSREK